MNVSVALCTYNGEKYIKEQLKSILNQTYDPYEIVICDDKSSDETTKKIRNIKQENPDLINLYLNGENVGIERNFGRCIERCSGDVITISDQDDIWHEEKIEREVDAYLENDVSLVFHNSAIVNNNLKRQGDLWSSAGYKALECMDQEYHLQELTKKNFVQGCTMLFDAELVDYINPIPEEWEYDYYIAVIAAMQNGLHPIGDELLYYRQHEEQAIGSPEDGLLRQCGDWIQSSVARDRHNFHQTELDRWEQVLTVGEMMPDTSSTKMSTLHQKCLFEEYRSNIYDSGVGVLPSFECFFDNWRSERYTQFTDNPRVHATKDLFGAFTTAF